LGTPAEMQTFLVGEAAGKHDGFGTGVLPFDGWVQSFGASGLSVPIAGAARFGHIDRRAQIACSLLPCIGPMRATTCGDTGSGPADRRGPNDAVKTIA